MELMKLGKEKSDIAGMYALNSIEDVLALTPYTKRHYWCNGTIIHGELAVTAVLGDGTRIPLEMSEDITDAAAYSGPPIDTTADTIGVQVAGLEVEALIFSYMVDNQNESEEIEEYLPLAPIDWGKLRRRVEDALRKSTDRATLFEFAQKLNVKII